jgi:hypothetical protein
MTLSDSVKKVLSILYLSSVFVIVVGVIFITSYLAYQENRDPVQYKSLVLNQNEYQSSQDFSYKFNSCRQAGVEVPGDISRSFVSVEQIDGKWVPVKGIGPVPLFDSTHVTNEKGCRESTIYTTIPNMRTGYYQLRIVGSYTKLNILEPSVDTIFSQTVKVTQTEKDSVSDLPQQPVQQQSSSTSSVQSASPYRQSSSAVQQQTTIQQQAPQPSQPVQRPQDMVVEIPNPTQPGLVSGLLTPILGGVRESVNNTTNNLLK